MPIKVLKWPNCLTYCTPTIHILPSIHFTALLSYNFVRTYLDKRQYLEEDTTHIGIYKDSKMALDLELLYFSRVSKVQLSKQILKTKSFFNYKTQLQSSPIL